MKTLLTLLALCACLNSSAQTPSTNTTSAVQLTWNPSLSTLVTSNITYTVFQGTATGNYSTNFQAGTNLTLTVSNLARGTEYFFAVTATAGGLTSAYSAEATYTALAIPASPTSLKVIIISP